MSSTADEFQFPVTLGPLKMDALECKCHNNEGINNTIYNTPDQGTDV